MERVEELKPQKFIDSKILAEDQKRTKKGCRTQ